MEFIIALVALVVIGIFLGVKTVSQGNQYTVERFGKYLKTLSPGLHVIIPIIDRIGAKVNMMEQVLDIPAQQVISQDNATVTIDAVCFYQVVDPVKATYEVNQLHRAMQNLVMTNIRTVLGSMDLDWMLSKRDEINARILTIVDEATNPWGVKVTRIEIKDILPPRDLVDAMAQQMKAERLKRAQILEAEGSKRSEVLEAEGEKQSQILKAEGEANATTMVSKAIAEGNVQAINYFVAQKYVEALGEIATSDNQKVLMLPLEASSVIGSVAGVAEIAKEAFGKNNS
jgi:regulator of protease activity HflC (stomatin/prohibitin superfamily)